MDNMVYGLFSKDMGQNDSNPWELIALYKKQETAENTKFLHELDDQMAQRLFHTDPCQFQVLPIQVQDIDALLAPGQPSTGSNGIHSFAKCRCGAVTVTAQTGQTYTCLYKNRKKFFPNVDFRSLNNRPMTHDCPYCRGEVTLETPVT